MIKIRGTFMCKAEIKLTRLDLEVDLGSVLLAALFASKGVFGIELLCFEVVGHAIHEIYLSSLRYFVLDHSLPQLT